MGEIFVEDEGNIAEALEVHMHAGEVLIEALKWTRNEVKSPILFIDLKLIFTFSKAHKFRRI